MTEYAAGIDISKYQGINFPWHRVGEVGVSFAFLRMGVGDGIGPNSGYDTTFDDNLDKAKEYGLYVGAYWYMWSVNVEAQIELFTRKFDASVYDFPPVVDFEQTNITEATLRRFLTELERITGRIPILYTNAATWHGSIGRGARDWAIRYPLWVANYTFAKHPFVPDPWLLSGEDWTIWQYGGMTIPEHTGPVDANWFNGTIEDLSCRYRQYKPNIKLRWPTDYDFVTQPFGVNPEHYVPLGVPGHEGVDIRAPLNANVYAAADGIVVGNTNYGAYGLHVRVRHPGELTTIYAHLNSVNVSIGQRVEAGQLIGKADSTGNSTGSHLHFGLKLKNATMLGLTSYPSDLIDPTSYLYMPQVESVELKMTADFAINLRLEPDSTSGDIGDIPVGAAVYGWPEPVVNGYIEIQYLNLRGWALAKWFQPTTVDQYVLLRTKATVDSNVNIRSGPALSYPIIGKIAPGSTIEGIPRDGDMFWKVRRSDLTGYSAAEFLEVVA